MCEDLTKLQYAGLMTALKENIARFQTSQSVDDLISYFMEL